MTNKADKIRNIRKLLQYDGVDSDTIERFVEWFFQNQLVWESFKRLGKKALAHDKKFGAKAIAEMCRWEMEIEKHNDDFKINNNYVAYMARLFNANIGKEYFETRNVRGLSDKEAA